MFLNIRVITAVEVNRAKDMDKKKDLNDTSKQKIINSLSKEHFVKRDDLPWMDQAEILYSAIQNFHEDVSLTQDDIMDCSTKFREAHEWMGAVSPVAGTIMTIHYNLCMATIMRQGNGSKKILAILKELEHFKSFGTFLGSELGYGINLVNLQTTATYDTASKTFKINTGDGGSKKFMPNTGHPNVPKIAVVLARLISNDRDHGVFPFIVRIRDKNGKPISGVKITPLGEKPGYPLDNAVTSFENVVVSKDMALLGEHCFLNNDGNFISKLKSQRSRFLNSIDQINGGRLCVSEIAVRGGLISSKIVYKYACNKKTFAPMQEDTALINYQNVRKTLLVCLGKTLSSEALLDSAFHLRASNSNNLSKESTRLCNTAKCHITEEAQQIAISLREKIGSQGMFCSNMIADYLVAAMGGVTAEGDNEVLKIKTSKDLLMDMSFLDLVGIKPRVFKHSLKSPEACMKVIEADLESQLREVKLSLYIKGIKGMNFFDSYNSEVNRLIEIGRINGNYEAFKAMLNNTTSNKTEISEEQYRNLTHLTMLDYIQSRSGSLLANKFISKKTVLNLHELENSLINKLSINMDVMFEMIDAPTTLIRSPLLMDTLEDGYKNF